MGGGSRSSPGSLDSIGWNPDKQIAFVTMAIFGLVLWLTKSILLAVSAVIMVCLPIPLVIKAYPWIQRKILFHSWYYKPQHDLKQPKLFGLDQAVNRYIGLYSIGCWYLQGKNDVVVVYCHGSSGSRGNTYRVTLVSFLYDLGCTVYTFDYRGYADSKGISSQANMIKDAKEVISTARKEHPNKKILLYGHSLGTGVVAQAAYQLKEEERPVDSIILEAPFSSIPEVLLDYPAVKLINNFPLYRGFVWKFADTFKTRDVIPSLSRVLILFAEDDEVIPTGHPKTLKELCPHSKLHLIPKGGHNFLILQDSVRNEIEEHIGSL